MGKHIPGTSEYSDQHSSSRDSTPHVTQTSYHHDGSRTKEHLYDEGSKSMADATREHKQSQRASRDSDSDSDGGGRVICTHFFQNGMLSRDLWLADIRHTKQHMSAKTVRGYHYWAIPYVRLMRRSSIAERLMFPLAKWRAEEIGYRVGIRSSPCFPGKIIRALGEPVCWLLGCFAPQRDWHVLQTNGCTQET